MKQTAKYRPSWYSILRGKDLETGLHSDDRREAQFGVLAEAQQRMLDLTAWHEFWKAVTAAGIRPTSPRCGTPPSPGRGGWRQAPVAGQ
jgi:hypothetical protein